MGEVIAYLNQAKVEYRIKQEQKVFFTIESEPEQVFIIKEKLNSLGTFG